MVINVELSRPGELFEVVEDGTNTADNWNVLSRRLFNLKRQIFSTAADALLTTKRQNPDDIAGEANNVCWEAERDPKTMRNVISVIRRESHSTPI